MDRKSNAELGETHEWMLLFDLPALLYIVPFIYVQH